MCFAAYLSKSNASIYWPSSSPPPPQTWNLRTTYRTSGWILSDLHHSTSVRVKDTQSVDGPRLDHIFIWMGPVPPTPPLPGLSHALCPQPAWELFFVGNQCDNSCVSVIGLLFVIGCLFLWVCGSMRNKEWAPQKHGSKRDWTTSLN